MSLQSVKFIRARIAKASRKATPGCMSRSSTAIASDHKDGRHVRLDSRVAYSSLPLLLRLFESRLIALASRRPILFADGRLRAPQLHALAGVGSDRITVVGATFLCCPRRRPSLRNSAGRYLPRRGRIRRPGARCRIG